MLRQLHGQLVPSLTRMIPFINLMHNALGSELVDFYKGDESAEEALADVEAAYRTAAKEAGFLQ